jgi:predicted negative regulator of RcsB-dependent stress response
MLAFLLTPFGRIVGYVAGGIMLAGLVFGWYELKIHEAKKEALASFNQMQLEEVIKEKDAMAAVNKTLATNLQQLQEQNSVLDGRVKESAGIANAAVDATKDDQLDPIFNQILGSLKGRK